MSCFLNLRTVKQLAQTNPAFGEPSLRWLIHKRNENGFSRCVVKIGGRVLIDLVEFEAWLSSHRSGNSQDSKSARAPQAG